MLDTNVIVSGLAGFAVAGSAPGEILQSWLRGGFELVISEPILDEVGTTLTNSYFRRRFLPEDVQDALTMLRSEGTTVRITAPVTKAATHPEDDLILATAVSANADYIATGDRGLQRLGTYQGIIILSPREFLDLLIANGLA